MKKFRVLTTLACLTLQQVLAAEPQATFPDQSSAKASNSASGLPTLFLIGDSTVNTPTKGVQGWGTPIAALFDQSKIHVENRARGGRSSRTYYTEGLWDQVAAALKPGDFVVMQFGHNDGGPLTDGRARASIKGNGEETKEVENQTTGIKETVHTYGWYLRKYIADTKAKGATPIVLSLIPRNMWKDGKVNRAANDYGKWAAEAAKIEGALFIELNEIVARHYEEIGEAKVMERYFTPADHTHTTPAGAQLNAACVIEGIQQLTECSLAGYVTKNPVFLYCRYFNAEGESRYLPDGTYQQVLKRLQKQFEVRANREAVTDASLAGVKLVLIANPSDKAVGGHPPPHHFSDADIEVLTRYVKNGGGLIVMGNQENHNLEVEDTNKLLARFGLGFTNLYTDVKKLAVPTGTPLIGGLAWAYYTGNLLLLDAQHPAHPRALVMNDDQKSLNGTRNQSGPLLAVAELGRGRVVAVTDAGWISNDVLEGKGIGGVVITNHDNWEIFRRLARWAAGLGEKAN